MKNDKAFQARIVAAMALMDLGDAKALEANRLQAKVDENKTVRTALTGIVKKFEEKIKTQG